MRSLLIMLISTLFLITSTTLKAQVENLNLLDTWIKGGNSGSMVFNYLNDQAFKYFDLRDKEISKLEIKTDWLNRQKQVKSILNEIVGPFPAKTPLNPRITGILKKDGYKVEKIMLESVPGYYITGCMFIPDGIIGKRPAILDNIGHSDGSFRKESYQNVIHNLVRKGFIVFAIDPVGQAEKDDYYDPLLKKSVIEEGEQAHCYFGNQCFISGFSVAKYFIWDGIRAIDYLCSRKEVDPARIGVTGLSGGGTVTSYLCAFDDRIKAAAPYNWAMYDRILMETHGEQGAETYIYHGLLKGITYADFLEVRAPKPTLLIKTTRDYLPIQAAREAYCETMKAYKAFGEEENFGIIEDDAEHQFTRKNNEATYAFFQKYLDLPGNPAEVEVEMLTREELKVSPTGLVSTYLNSETVFSLNKKETEGLIINLEESRINITAHLDKVREKAIELSGYKVPEDEIKIFFSGRYKRNGYSVEKYTIEVENNYVIPMLLFVPDGIKKYPAVIYLHPEGKMAQSVVGGQIEELVKEGFIVAAPDLLGLGETQNKFRSNEPVIIDYCAILIGRSLVGIQAGDIVRVVNYLKSRNDVDKETIVAVAIGEMGPVLLHAAAFDRSIRHIVLLGSPLSYKSIVLNKFYEIKFSCAVAGALTAYDLPDLIGCISPGKVVLAESTDHMLRPASQELIDQELEFPRKVYSYKNVTGNLKVLTSPGNPGQLLKWCFE
jgi:cephalosporin-C deacetylase-like acetyl esterase